MFNFFQKVKIISHTHKEDKNFIVIFLPFIDIHRLDISGRIEMMEN